ncbi:hypothetical protein M413DRAFT_32796 [Hebeloma cylindrosporum]|uniref:Uncharacterized protein n=1 Tax=Hebeloma cylindrosporum TaxID=76867 RepID=A0A0C2Y1Z2_HEBCY|nr:hypothetical protein M413DRAFT_32796 [Hebeloma cylindrosporum h7]
MSLYPDNTNRANRVRQLCLDISHFQTQMKEDVEDAHASDEAAIKILDIIAHDAGYKTLDEYVAAAATQLSAEDRAAFDKMKTDLENLDEAMNISHRVFRGLIALGLLTHGVRIFALAFKQTQSILFGIQALVRSIYHAALGAVETAVKLATWGRVTLNFASRAEGIGAEALEGMKFLKIGGSVLVGIGVLVDAGLLIAEAIQGSRQRDDLRAAIIDLCARRFIVKQMQQKARVLRNFKSDAKSMVKTKTRCDKWIKQGRMTAKEAGEEMQPDMDEIEEKIQTAMSAITSKTIWDSLDTQDNDSKVAWKDEDPNLARILQWITDHPQGKEKNGDDKKEKETPKIEETKDDRTIRMEEATQRSKEALKRKRQEEKKKKKPMDMWV